MGENRIDPRQQFSKWLARYTSIYWFFYMTYVATLIILHPEASDAVVYLSIIASVVMIINVWAYTKNSVYEKALLAGADKNFKFSWKNSKQEESEDTQEEEGEADG